ncbi:hypothetical protein N7493_000507 [Penicillium malachiteum]|uniref:DUF7603 domain-containing protein n=1 Tax=Penicillium malachiteum TaxID=1324776 RepID=A0AAD6N1I0_9EURO|nr:hypothetical protein N7493_000507 [Penicillium malachiteum]
MASLNSSATSPPIQRKPLPHAIPIPTLNPSPLSEHYQDDILPHSSVSLSSPEEPSFISPRNSNRYSRQRHLAQPLRIDTGAPASYLSSVVDHDDDSEDGEDYFDDGSYEQQFTHGTPSTLHNRLVSEPFIPVLASPPPSQRRASTMALHPPLNRPPPLQIDINDRPVSMGPDPRQPKTPGNKISSFFGWKGNTTTSPGGESSSTEISDGGRSPMPSPMPPLANVPMKPSSYDSSKSSINYGLPARTPSVSGMSAQEVMYASKFADLENELREISSELAGSIRREMELEDLIERFQTEVPETNRRTSDYFSDSGTSIVRSASDAGRMEEDIGKIRRAAEQERAQLKVELSQKLQEERLKRTASESHVQILENQVQQLRRERVDLSDLSSKTRELETALEDTRRKLLEERQSKDNFEDLLTAMRVELEQLRNERDILREVKPQAPPPPPPPPPTPPPPQVQTPSPDTQRLMEEIEALRVENASLAQLQTSGRFASIAEEEGGVNKRNSTFGISRSNSVVRKPSGLARSGSLSRSNSVNASKDRKERESGGEGSLVDKVKDIESQRDALHRTLRSLLDRHAQQAREYEKRARLMEMELERAQQAGPLRRPGYERDVQTLREEVNHLRNRAEDALDGKWQCEKNLAGLKMDLDRAEQETSSLRVLLQEHDSVVSEGGEADESFAEVMETSSSLDSAYKQLQADRKQVEATIAASDELEAAFGRTDRMAYDVQQQLHTNNSLRGRLESAIDKGERDQHLSVERINFLQNRLKEYEDSLLLAQHHSEDEMGKHEEEIRLLKENHNAQLLRMKTGARTAVAFSPRPANAPFSSRSPRLDKTTSGQGIPLIQVVQVEALEKRVKDLEKLLRDADMEMEEVVGRMNRTQVDVAQLQSDRDEALRQTRLLQANIQTERDAFKALLGHA